MTGTVVVTGLGAVSPLGISVDALWQRALVGESVVENIPEQWRNYTDFNSGIWSPLPDIDFRDQGFSRTEVLQRDRVSLLGLMASQEALKNAGFSTLLVDKRHAQYSVEGVDAQRIGVFIGTGIGGAKTFLENHSFQMLSRPLKACRSALSFDAFEAIEPSLAGLVHPVKFNRMAVPMLMPNGVSASIGIKYGVRGQNRTVANACAAGTSAIGDAYQAIVSGELDVAICGGAEYLYDDYGTIYRGFDALGALAKPSTDIYRANRPFDEARNGFLFAQGGAGILILESASHAQKRGAGVLAKISGFAESFDAQSMVALADDGLQVERAINTALEKAGTTLESVDYINAHGTGTEINDRVEGAVLQRLFGTKPWVASSKSFLGHSIGASGALEAIITVLTLKNQCSPACMNLDDPIYDLRFVRERNQVTPVDTALSCSYAFGGHNAALVMQHA